MSESIPQSPIEQILSGFEGLELVHFIPVIIIFVLMLLMGAHKNHGRRRKTWVKGKGFVSNYDVMAEKLEKLSPEQQADIAAKLGLDKVDSPKFPRNETDEPLS